MFRKTTKLIAVLMLIALAITAAPLNSSAYAAATPTAVKGRILKPSETGDTVNWVEIAQFGNYSLIVRTDYLNTYSTKGYYGNAKWQYIPFGATTAYSTSNVYKKINAWFTGANSVNGDNLAANAKLRNFTVENNALNALGTASDENGKTNGFSIPTDKKRGTGDDIAFALSYSEAVNFISIRYYTWQKGYVQSSDIAKENYKNISIPLAAAAGSTNSSGAWLRSQGYGAVTVGSLSNGMKVDGSAFQYALTNTDAEKGFLYPALWVDSSIFGVKACTVTYSANDGISQEIKVPVNAGDSYKVVNQNFTRDGYTLVGFNTAADGTGTAYTAGQSFKVSDNVTLYAQWTRDQFSITYDPNGGTGSVVNVPVNAGNNYTVVTQNYALNGYVLAGFNTEANGSGKLYNIGQSFTVIEHIKLYAQWVKNQNLCTLSFNPNGGVGETVNVTVGVLTIYNISSQGFYWNGYTLEGFTTEPDGSGKLYKIGESVKITADTSLYAKWEGTGSGNTYCTVTYISVHNNLQYYVSESNILVGSEYKLKSPTELGLKLVEGKHFKYWTDALSGSGNNFFEGNSVTIKGDMTLYVVYVK